MDIGSRFVTSDGTLRRHLMPDGIHPNEAGYQIWADALGAIIHSSSDVAYKNAGFGVA